MNNGLQKKYGLFTAICMVVGIVIGSGVFFKAQTILEKTGGDMPLGILAWIIGGIIMLCCILAFAIMAQRYEKVNGVVDYAEATVGGKYAYFMGWFLTTIYYPTLTSVLAWLSARYTLVFVTSVNPSFEVNPVVGPECMAVACFYLIASYTVNALSPKLAGKFQTTTTVIKLIPLILMGVAGIIYGLTNINEGQTATILAQNFDTSKGDYSVLFGAVVATAFAYEGWVIATSINAELKNSKKNLPKALIAGSIIIITIYVLYYIGVAGGANVDNLIADGATTAFINVFGTFFGNILNLFIAISCLGTLNGLMLGCTRGLYSLSARNNGPKPETFGQIDKSTNMPTNSSIFGLLLCGAWFLYFYGANLTNNWFGLFGFDSSELPIVTIYAMYIPIFIMYIVKEKNEKPLRRFVIPVLALIGSVFMVIAAVYAHGISSYNSEKTKISDITTETIKTIDDEKDLTVIYVPGKTETKEATPFYGIMITSGDKETSVPASDMTFDEENGSYSYVIDRKTSNDGILVQAFENESETASISDRDNMPQSGEFVFSWNDYPSTKGSEANTMKYFIEGGGFSCPILFYLIVYVVVMIIGAFFYKKNRETK